VALGERRGKSAEECATIFGADWPEPIAHGAVRAYRVIDIQEAEQKDTTVSVLQKPAAVIQDYAARLDPPKWSFAGDNSGSNSGLKCRLCRGKASNYLCLK
jgi:hypothetical protein